MYRFSIYLGVSSHSVESDLSSDYAIPPDETIESDSSDEPELKLLKYTAESLKKVWILEIYN